jgi:very-short-patch-repair endonuclease
MTPAERTLWAEIRGRQLDGAKFRRQQVIAGYIADFYCHAARLVVELDGPLHRHQAEYDAERDKAIRLYGLHVLRFTNDDVENDLDTVLSTIAAAIRQSMGGTDGTQQRQSSQ